MPLSLFEVQTVDRLRAKLDAAAPYDELMLRYYQGLQRVEHMGLAVPPSLRRFMVVANWPRVVVDTIDSRQQVRSLVLPGEETADPRLRAIWDGSNMDAHLSMFNIDRMVYGRAFLSVGANEDDPELPIIRVESPREMVAEVDVRRERVTVAARFYGAHPTTGQTPVHVTLYLPDVTVWIDRTEDGRWVEVDRDQHRLGQVPIVAHLNRRLSGSWVGESQMTDVIPLTDSAARALTLMQFSQEAHGAPDKFITGVAAGDFTDASGALIPKVEAYFNTLKLVTNPQAKVGAIPAAELKNFETALDAYGRQASVVTGFPARYFGLHTANPPAEGAIKADEATLTRSVEQQNTQVGKSLGWTAALAMRFVTGEWISGNRVRADWHDPATPTVAQRMDATVKAKQSGILSREGAWDEFGWSEARKAKERAYFAAEASDPLLALGRDLMAGSISAANGDG